MSKIQNQEISSNTRFDAYIVSKRKDRVFVVDRDRCKGCAICSKICPSDSLFMSHDKSKRGFFYPMENASCIACKKCLFACPDFALSIHKLDEVALE